MRLLAPACHATTALVVPTAAAIAAAGTTSAVVVWHAGATDAAYGFAQIPERSHRQQQ